jgi:hypothetical protein
VTVALTLLGFAACARQGSPPGGPPDRIPPFVVSTTPDTFATVEPFGDAVRVEFNERISERVSGGIDNSVEISPRTGDVRVRHRRRRIDVSMSGGFVEGVVYRITVMPVIQDMFGNSLNQPFEFFFSTGPPFTDNAIAGVLEDRISGEPVTQARVDAWREDEDSLKHTTVSDDQGIFAIRRVPGGSYRIRAYVDVNRTFEPDFIELQGEAPPQPLGPNDTVLVFMDLLQPDSTPADLIAVDALDSLTLELGFDDFLDPDSALTGVGVSMSPDSLQEDVTGAPTVIRLLHEHEYRIYADSLQAVADSLQAIADSLAALEAQADTTGAAPAPAAGLPAPGLLDEPAGAALPVDGRLAPSQLIYAVLSEPMVPLAVYRVAVSDVTNIVGLPGGGGESLVTGPEPPPPDTVVADSLAVPDSVGAAPEGAEDPAPDTALAPVTGDTLTPPDTASLALRGARLGPVASHGRRSPNAWVRRLRD